MRFFAAARFRRSLWLTRPPVSSCWMTTMARRFRRAQTPNAGLTGARTARTRFDRGVARSARSVEASVTVQTAARSRVPRVRGRRKYRVVPLEHRKISLMSRQSQKKRKKSNVFLLPPRPPCLAAKPSCSTAVDASAHPGSSSPVASRQTLAHRRPLGGPTPTTRPELGARCRRSSTSRCAPRRSAPAPREPPLAPRRGCPRLSSLAFPRISPVVASPHLPSLPPLPLSPSSSRSSFSSARARTSR
jgi:hypothetical protein